MAETNLGRIVGSRIYTGTQPSTALDGDIYINTSGEMYVYDGSSSKWTDYASLKGESGASITYYTHVGEFTLGGGAARVYISYVSTSSSANTAAQVYSIFGTKPLPAVTGSAPTSSMNRMTLTARMVSASSVELFTVNSSGTLEYYTSEIDSYTESVTQII